jgi:iron complex outermembrane recepter protein
MLVSNIRCSGLRRRALLLSASLLATTAASANTTVKSALDIVPPTESAVEEILVSGAFEGRKIGETILGATVLTKDDLARQINGSIGETLRRQPGISSSFFGPGASRPVIRGLGGARIRVLDFGLGSLDASSTSPDHAVAADPALAERIEILRGTAMLMYGSSAAGGVINIFDGRIPAAAPEDGIEGAVRYGHSSVDNGNAVTAAINAGLGDVGNAEIIFHGDVSWRETQDYKIPGFEKSGILRGLEGDDGTDRGVAENSATRIKAGSAGLSAIFESGFFGMNIKKLNSQYGLPGGSSGEEDPVTIDLNQTRFDLHGELEASSGWFQKAKFRFGYGDYLHTELEGQAIGTVFANQGWEGRLDLMEKGGKHWNGATGIQMQYRDFSAIGAEAFVPATKSTQVGLYNVKEFSFGPWQFEVGGRYEYAKHQVDSLNVTRSFSGFSGSAGAGYDLSEAAFLGFSVFRTERAPALEELFSNGPHLATNAFERGDRSLGLETALGFEATFSYASGPFSFVANGFYTSYNDFIYERETGETEDNLPVFIFRAADARLYGFEAQIKAHLGSMKVGSFGEIDWHLDSQLDYVRARLRNISGDTDLPRIPPLSALIGIEANTALVKVRVEMEYAAAQNNIAAFERATEGYSLWNVYLTAHPFKDRNLSIEVRGSNLGNTDARQHTSFLKDFIPLPGRNLRISLRAGF